jgi:hypothetical protein
VHELQRDRPVSSGIWFGLTRDNSPLVLRDVGTEEIYSLDLSTHSAAKDQTSRSLSRMVVGSKIEGKGAAKQMQRSTGRSGLTLPSLQPARFPTTWSPGRAFVDIDPLNFAAHILLARQSAGNIAAPDD